MLKIYKIERKDNFHSYTMICSFVIIAKNRKELRKIAYNNDFSNSWNYENNWLIKNKTKIKFIGFSHLKSQIIQTNIIDG
jgi:hypothetical protein